MSKYHSGAKYEFRQDLKPGVAPLTTAISGVLVAGALQAATITVDTLDDGHMAGKCTLRSALAAATSNGAVAGCTAGEPGLDQIIFDSSLSGTIQLADAGYPSLPSALRIGESVQINGGGEITVRGDGTSPVFYAKYDPPTHTVDELVLYGLTITGGNASDYGGGILSYANTLTLVTTTVTGNTAGAGGGGIFHRPGSLAGQLNVLYSTISHNTSAGPGGGVHVASPWGSSALSWVFNSYASTFENNLALQGTGGGAFVYSGDWSYVRAIHSSFLSNTAKYGDYGHGGGLYMDLGYAEVDLKGAYFIGNEASGYGGGLALREDSSLFRRGVVQIEDGFFYYNDAGKAGGGAFVEILSGGYAGPDTANPYKLLNVIDTGFHFNRSDQAGGGLAVKAIEEVPVRLIGSAFSNNESRWSGGAVHADMQDSVLSLYETRFLYNETLEGAGGGMYARLEEGELEAEGLGVYSNTSHQSSGGGFEIRLSEGANAALAYASVFDNKALDGCGGGMRIQSGMDSQAALGQSIFAYNYASYCGGGLTLRSVEEGTGMPAIMDAKYSEFTENHAGPGGGGAIFTQLDDDGLVTISSSTLSGNTSSGKGSAIRSYAASLELKYSTLAYNRSYLAGTGAVATSPSTTSCAVTGSLLGFNEDDDGILRDLRGDRDCEVRRSLIHGAAGSSYQDDGGNLLNLDPGIEALAANGGTGGFWETSLTHALRPDSPAIDAAGVAGAGVPTYDQRGPGFARMVGVAVDMGAFEEQTAQELIFQDRFEQ